MSSILELCQPRPEILTGKFNPEVFTAALAPVLAHYRGEKTAIDRIYTDTELFFQEGTYATAGLRRLLAGVFGRHRRG